MMIKSCRNILRAYLKQHTKAQSKIKKSKLLIYDEHLNKYVSVEELLIPAEPKKGEESLCMNTSKEFLLFDLLLKKFVNPKLDLLTPGIKNTKQLTRIYDFRIQHENFNSYSTDSFWGKKKRTNNHFPALPPVHDKTNNIEDGSSKVGWAGQATNKPNSDPRPEHSNTSCSIGPGKDPRKEKPKNKKEKDKKVMVCEKNKICHPPLEKNVELEEEFCFPISKREQNTSLQHQNIDKSSNESSKPAKQQKKETRSNKKENKNVFKKLCSHFFSSGKSVDSCHKLKTSESKNTTKEQNKDKELSKHYEQKSNETSPCGSKDKKLVESDQDPYTTICPPKPPVKVKQDICQNLENTVGSRGKILEENQELGIENVCNSKPVDNSCFKPSDESKSLDLSKNETKTTQTPCDKSDKNQSLDKPRISKKEKVKLATKKTCFENKGVKSCGDLSTELLIKECKKSMTQSQTCSPKEKDTLGKGNKQCASKLVTKNEAQCIKESRKYNFMVRPKTCNLQELQTKKEDLAECKGLINKDCKCCQKPPEKKCLEEQKSVSPDNDGSCLKKGAVTETANKKSSENKKPCPKSEKKSTCKVQKVKNSPSGPQLCTNTTKTSENKKIRRKSKEKTCTGIKEAVKGSLSAPQLSSKKNNKCDKEETIKTNANQKQKCVPKKGLQPALDKSGDIKKCKEVHEPQKKESSKAKNLSKKSSASSTVKCQHVEAGITEKLQNITRDKCFEEAKAADINKAGTYMGFKIAKSTSDTKQTKTSSKKGSKTRCNISTPIAKGNTKGIEKTKNKPTRPKEKISCAKPKVCHQNLKSSKTEQCLKKGLGNEESFQGTCSKKTKMPKDNCHKNASLDRHTPELGKDDLCSGKLEAGKPKNCYNQDDKSKQPANKSEDSKKLCSQPVSECGSKTKSKKITNVKSKTPGCSAIGEQCVNASTTETCSRKIVSGDPGEPCEVKEEQSLLNNCTEISNCCKLSSSAENSDLSNESRPLVTAPSENDNAVNNEKCACPKSIESEKGGLEKLNDEEDHVASNEKSTEEKKHSEKTEGEISCVSLNKGSEKNSSVPKVVTQEKKDEKQPKLEEKSKISIKYSKDGGEKNATLEKTKSCESTSKKPWKKSASKTPKKSKSAIVCTSNSYKSPNSKQKKYQPYSKAPTSKNKIDADKKQLHKTKSSIELSINDNQNKVGDQQNKNATNQPSNKRKNKNKKTKFVKQLTVCSRSTPNLTTVKQDIVPGTKKSSDKINKSVEQTNYSRSMPNMLKNPTANKVELQQVLKGKSEKLCSIQNLNKRTTENLVKPSKRVEVKSFSELKSVSSPEINKLAVSVGTKEPWRNHSYVNVKEIKTNKKLVRDQFSSPLEKDSSMSNDQKFLNMRHITPKFSPNSLNRAEISTNPVTSGIKDVMPDGNSKKIPGKPSLKDAKDKVFENQLRMSQDKKFDIKNEENPKIKKQLLGINHNYFQINDKIGLQIESSQSKNEIHHFHLENRSKSDTKKIISENNHKSNVSKLNKKSDSGIDKKRTKITIGDQHKLSSGIITDNKMSKNTTGNLIKIDKVEKEIRTLYEKSSDFNNITKETIKYKSVSNKKNPVQRTTNEHLNQVQAKTFLQPSNKTAVYTQSVIKDPQNVETKQKISKHVPLMKSLNQYNKLSATHKIRDKSKTKNTLMETRANENVERLKNNTINTKEELKNIIETANLMFEHSTPLKKAEYQTVGKSKNNSEKKHKKHTINDNLFKTMTVNTLKEKDTCSAKNYNVPRTKVEKKPSSSVDKTENNSYRKDKDIKMEKPTNYLQSPVKSKLKSMSKNKEFVKNRKESSGFMPKSDLNDILKLAIDEAHNTVQNNIETGVKVSLNRTYNNSIRTTNELVEGLESSNKNQVVDLKPLKPLVVDKRLKKIAKKDPLLRNRQPERNTLSNENEGFGFNNRSQKNPNLPIIENGTSIKQNQNIKAPSKEPDSFKESKAAETPYDVKNRSLSLSTDKKDLAQSMDGKYNVLPSNCNSKNQYCTVKKPTKRNRTTVSESKEMSGAKSYTFLNSNDSPQAINVIPTFQSKSLKGPKFKYVPTIKK